jgi:antitoxin FitA
LITAKAHSHAKWIETEEEVKSILPSAANEQDVPAGGLGTEISALFTEVGLESDIPELRGHEVEPASFEE